MQVKGSVNKESKLIFRLHPNLSVSLRESYALKRLILKS
jgi:hypothetical protein